jgi:thiamine kinase-like enzyme
MLKKLIKSLSLGNRLLEQKILTGGALHKMWGLKTDQGIYVAKQINPHITTKDTFPQSYELSELVANKFSESNIPAVAAIKIDKQYVQKISSDYFILYPFIDGNFVDAPALNKQHAYIIGAIFAKMHNLNLHVAGIEEPYYNIFSNDHWQQLITASKHEQLNKLIEQIISWNCIYIDGIEELNDKLIITHGDMHYKNVLWDNTGSPHIIDWESAGLMNPMLEIIGYGLEWSGAIHGEFNQNICSTLLVAYKNNIDLKFDTNISLAFHGWLGHCVLGWTEFNIRRMLGLVRDDKVEIKLGEDIINGKMIPALNFLWNHQKDIIHLLDDSWK